MLPTFVCDIFAGCEAHFSGLVALLRICSPSNKMLVRLHLQSEEEIVLVMEINNKVKLGEEIKDR